MGIGWLMLGVEELILLPAIAATPAEVEGLVSLRDRWKVQDLEAALFDKVACQVVLMHPLHHHHDPHRGLVIVARQQG
jgi:hypothetical protein